MVGTQQTPFLATQGKPGHHHEDYLRCGGDCMRIAVFLSVLLLSACANFPHAGNATGAVQENRQSDATAQPSASQKTSPVEVQPQAPVDQTPKKREHNVEED
jgi:hypothetical protein